MASKTRIRTRKPRRDPLRLKSHDVKHKGKVDNYPDDLKSAENSDGSLADVHRRRRRKFGSPPCVFLQHLPEEDREGSNRRDCLRTVKVYPPATVRRLIRDVHVKDIPEMQQTTVGKRRSETKQRRNRVTDGRKTNTIPEGNSALSKHKSNTTPVNDKSEGNVRNFRSSQTQNITNTAENTKLTTERNPSKYSNCPQDIPPRSPEHDSPRPTFQDIYTSIYCRATSSVHAPRAEHANNIHIKTSKSVRKLIHQEHPLKNKSTKHTTNKHLVLTDKKTINSPFSATLTRNEGTYNESCTTFKGKPTTTNAKKDIKHHFKENAFNSGLLPTIPEGYASKNEYKIYNKHWHFLRNLLAYETRLPKPMVHRSPMKNYDINDLKPSPRNVGDKMDAVQSKKKQFPSPNIKNRRSKKQPERKARKKNTFPLELMDASESEYDLFEKMYLHNHNPTLSTSREPNMLYTYGKELN